MRFEVEYDTAFEDEQHFLIPSEVPLLGVEPVSIVDGKIATYEFSPEVSEEEIFEALDQSNWCFVGATEVADPEGTPSL